MSALFETLEWPVLLAHLESCCSTGYGRVLVAEETLFLDSAQAMSEEMVRVDEAKTLLFRIGEPPLQEPVDVVPTLARLAKGGAFLSAEEASACLVTLKTLRQLTRFFTQNVRKDWTPLLFQELSGFSAPNETIDALAQVVTEEGVLQEDASEAYRRLNQRIRDLGGDIRQKLHRLMQQSNVSKALQEALVTQRDGRFVLPVKVEQKGEVPGIVLGVSSTGGTLYVEPHGVVETNNTLIRLQAEREQEIRRILEALSEALRPSVSTLFLFVQAAGQLDLCLAKARQSKILKANPVTVLPQPGVFNLKDARHPLLQLQGNVVVPNSVTFAPPLQILLITGPNTGGKTVLLKLLGLCALMARCGLHLPVAEGSSLSVFDPVFADIGDPQDLSQNLSTFSGHIARMRQIVEAPSLASALVLVDEICAGTDPAEGAALAKALLGTFVDKGSTAVVTTHIGELKVFAHDREAYLNASVEFDAESLKPTYRLLLGVPGTSHALNIATRLGMDIGLIERAKGHLAAPVSDSARLIESLELQNRALSEELAEAQRLKEAIAWEEEQLRLTLNRIEGEKKKTLQLFREGLKDKLRGVEAQVDALKQDLKAPKKTDAKAVQKLSGRYKSAASQTGEIFTSEQDKLYPSPDIAWDKLSVGDVVESRSLNMRATIVAKHAGRKELTLEAGILKTTVPLSDIILQAPKQKPSPGARRKARGASGGSHHTSASAAPARVGRSWSSECDVRGFTSDEAIFTLETALDEALLDNHEVVCVIHGLGTGVLKQAIRQYLKNLSFVKRFEPGQATEGGDGVTLVYLA